MACAGECSSVRTFFLSRLSREAKILQSPGLIILMRSVQFVASQTVEFVQDLAQQYSAELSPVLFGDGDCFLVYVQRYFINSCAE
uniref:Uncharacterized protein n=1 Tax=Oryza glumipatula TaxID=40148 RepID=A0A0E0BVN9_9ORYZ